MIELIGYTCGIRGAILNCSAENNSLQCHSFETCPGKEKSRDRSQGFLKSR